MMQSPRTPLFHDTMKGHEQLDWFVFLFKIVPQCVAQILAALHAQRLFVQLTGYDVWCNVPAM